METAGSISVLIVDDEEDVRALLQQILSGAGYSCQQAATGADALALLARESFAIVLCDINMPGLSGFDVLHQGRRQPEPPAFIMVTALSDRATAITALNKGACGYIVKPFTAEEVLIQVEIALHLRTLELENCHIRQNLELLVAERTAELSRRIAEQRRTEGNLRAALDKLQVSEKENQITLAHLQTIIQSIPYPFYVVDVRNYQVIMANSAASANGAWHGQTCHALTHHQATPCDSDGPPCLPSAGSGENWQAGGGRTHPSPARRHRWLFRGPRLPAR